MADNHLKVPYCNHGGPAMAHQTGWEAVSISA